MSGFIGTGGVDNGPQSVLGVTGSSVPSELMQLLAAQEITPGSEPSYQLCKVIYVAHPMGKKMVDAPIDMAQSQQREITIPGCPEERLLDAFNRTWKTLGNVGADMLIAYAARISRIYGVGVMAMGVRGQEHNVAIDRTKLHELQGDLYFSVLDPLNTAGSLVLNQDPNSPDYQKPTVVRANGVAYHPDNIVVQFNEQPLYIQWTDSAFGFSGRSVYQRALFPLKSYIQTMITNDLVSYKAGVIVAKMKSNTSNTNGRVAQFFSAKRANIKTANTGNVLGIGTEEDIMSLNFQNLEAPFRLARENIIKDLATACDAPARVLDQETLSGNSLADGSEDAKNIARWVERFRVVLQPLYLFFDEIVQRIAWSPAFYDDLKRDGLIPRGMSYEAAFYQWRNAFDARWPNLLIEPEKDRLEGEEMRFKSVVALYEVLSAQMMAAPKAKAELTRWVQEEVNSRKELFSAELDIDVDAFLKELESTPAPNAQEDEPTPFSYET